ncbi:MAG: tetratricopeptide repeat protein [Akkermansiaceae bacterium]|nr:tetratricopeptide repeat protein [Armatimonadota bacterium]
MADVFSYQERRSAAPDKRSSISDTGVALRMQLFGTMEVRVGGEPMPRLRSRKGLWLLALLTLRAGRDVERDWLAGVLWPEHRDDAARRSLRQSLHDLRSALGPEATRLSCESPRTLRLDISSGAWVDVVEFDAATLAPRYERQPEALEAAIDLYRGPLLEDCAEEWVLEERRQRVQQYLATLETLAATATIYSGHTVSTNYLRLAISVDPLREDLQRALMKSLAADGSISAALLIFRQFRTHLWQEMATEPDAETTALYRRLRDEARKTARIDAAVEPASAEPVIANPSLAFLPRPRTELIGREADGEEVITHLTRSRLVTLTGTGGVGKTRLSLQVAEKMADEFEGGARFVDLAPLTDPMDVPEAVRKALGVAQKGEEARQPLIEFLCRTLSSRLLLLVLDNCEQVLDACATLTDALLTTCPGVRILATSRQALGLRGEVIWRVPSLAVPPANSDTAEYENYAAIRLFVARAQEAEPSFLLTPRNAAALARVCRRLDGIPLAIELAAARVRALTVEEIDARLDNQFRLLTGGDRAALPRQRTLQGALDWSWDLLTEPERLLLSRLSVFAGGTTLEAVESVCAGELVDETEILNLITALLDKSLVVVEKREGVTTRYRLLETVRQYGRDRLTERGNSEAVTVRTRHQEYFLALTHRLTANRGIQKIEKLEQLEGEQDNLRTALEWQEQTTPGKRDVALRILDLAGALGSFWSYRSNVREGREYLRAALSFATEAWGDENDNSYLTARAKALRAISSLMREQGDYNEAQTFYEETVKTYRHLGDRHNVASALSEMGVLAQFQSDYPRAQSLLEEGLAVYRELEDRDCIAISLSALGVLAGSLGELDQAHALLEESLMIFRQTGSQRGVGVVLTNLGINARDRGDYTVARHLFEEALGIHREMGNQRSVAIALLNLGGSLCDLEDYSAAGNGLDEALAIFRQASNKQGIATTLTALGMVANYQNDPAQARSLLSESLRLHRELGDRKNVAAALQAVAAVNAAQERWVEAMHLWGAVERLREVLGTPLLPGERREYEQQVSRARMTLGEEASHSAWAEGRAMDYNDICDRAVS